MLGLDTHGHVVLAVQAVGYDDRGAHHRRGETVQIGGLKMIHGIVAAAGIQGGGVRQKGLAPGVHDLVHHLAHQGGIEMGVVAVFAEMEFDGREVIFFDDFFQAHGVAEAGHLGDFAVLK